MPIPKDKKGLTIKQKKFVKAYVANDGNGTEAALSTYDTKDIPTAAAIGSENLSKPHVKDAIESALEKHGITIEAATKPIADGLHAMRTIGFSKDSDGETWDVADHSVRLKAAGMALKLMGADKSDPDANPKGNTIIFANKANFNSGDYKD